MMKNIKFKGMKFFTFVVILYIILFFINIDNGFISLKTSALVIVKLLPVFLAVILLTAVINFFLKPKHIAKYLGEDSGAKGWFYALLGGVVSHGPMYVWYPMFEDMKQHGLKNSLIAVFFYSRAIKLPLLPLLIDYFGVIFTVVLSLYILLGALIQGYMIERIEGAY